MLVLSSSSSDELFDQAHMINEFHALCGQTPAGLSPSARRAPMTAIAGAR
jgi:hypothetical protein